MARFYANTIGGFKFSHTLITVRIVPEDPAIFTDVCKDDINIVVRKRLNGEDSPNTMTRAGNSLLALVSQPNYQKPF
jgi:hypothetical protein